MRDQLKNAMIGIFVISALAIVIFIMLFLHPNVGNEGKILRVRFADVDKITPGTRVNFGGKPVGEVLEVQEIKTETGDRIEHNGIIYVYELTLAIDSGVTVYTTDVIESRTSGLLGEKSVAITPMPVGMGVRLIPVNGEILYAAESRSVETTLKEFKALSDKIELTLDGFIDVFNKLNEERVWENVGVAVDNLADISMTVNQPDKLTSMVDNATSVLHNLEETTTALNEPQKIRASVDNVASVTESMKDVVVKHIENISQNIDNMVVNIKNGEGSLGSFLTNDDLYLRLASLMSKGEVIFNDINHYGLLFHLDKGWQRLRARRLNLLATLCNPQEFRNYFNDELDLITTSLERVSLVLEKTSDDCSCIGLWQTPEYKKVYSELLRRVATLEESLQMYNQQVVDCEINNTEF